MHEIFGGEPLRKIFGGEPYYIKTIHKVDVLDNHGETICQISNIKDGLLCLVNEKDMFDYENIRPFSLCYKTIQTRSMKDVVSEEFHYLLNGFIVISGMRFDCNAHGVMVDMDTRDHWCFVLNMRRDIQ